MMVSFPEGFCWTCVMSWNTDGSSSTSVSGTVDAGGGLGVPFAVGGLVFDRLGAPRHALLGGGAPGRGERRGVACEWLREHAVDGVGPAAVMLDDPVDDMGHVSGTRSGLPGRGVNVSPFYAKMSHAPCRNVCVPDQAGQGRRKCAATSRRCSISSRPRRWRKSMPRRCNSCASFPASIPRRRPMPRRSIAPFHEVSAAARRLLASLQTHAPARDREIEAEKARERSRLRFG